MMTIGEFAKRTGLSISALRFYADRGLVPPAEIDTSNGYRLYREDQIADGILVRTLRRLDMSLNVIKQALDLSDSERQELVETHLERLEQVLHRAHTVAQSMGVSPATKEEAMPETTLQSVDLSQALGQVLPAVGTDPELPHLMGVLLEGKEGSLRLVATDRFRLAIRDLVPNRMAGEFSAVVAGATLNKWRDLVTAAETVSISLEGQNLTVRGEGVELSGSIVPTTFPDYESFLQSAAHVSSVVMDRQSLLRALESFVGSGHIMIVTSPSEVVITRDESAVSLAAECEGPSQQIAVNPRFAAEATRNALGVEVVMEIEDSLRPVLFRSADDGTYTSLIMPVKVD